MKRKIWLNLVLLLSGLSGISYEILYGRILGSILGDQFAVSAAVLITFLLGIGCGAKYAHRFWPKLWLIEALIGVYGIGFTLLRNAVEFLLYNGLSFLPPLFGSIFLGCMLLLLPAFLIGCSVPLFAGYLERIDGESLFSTTYAIYNFGAALTAILIEFWLIRQFGIGGTVVAFGLVNLCSAAILYRAGAPIALEPPAAAAGQAGLAKNEMLSLILVSMASAVFQLFMVKIAELMFGPFRETFALVLAIILFGIALGSLLAKLFRIRYAALLFINLAGLLLFLLSYRPLLEFYSILYQAAAAHGLAIVVLKGVVLFILMGLPAITFGATVPALVRGRREVASESGELLFVSSLANAGGFLLMAFVLHQYLDYGVQLLAVSFLVLAAIIVFCWRQYRLPLVAVLLTLATVGIHRYQWDEDLLYLSYTSFHSPAEMANDRRTFNFPDKFKGYQDVFSINWMNGAPYFFINGYISFPMNSPSEKVVGTVGPMFSPRVNNALVLGLGSGTTASVVGQLFAATDVIEINPVVRANQFRMKRWNYDIEHNPRVTIMVDDAIHYTKVSDKRYDMILNTVTSPLYFSSSKLYTSDFFRVIKKRLNPGGIYVSWMDVRVGSRGAEIILQSLKPNFRHCAILFIKSGYFLLIASSDEIRLHHPDLASSAPLLQRDLMSSHALDPALFPYQLLTTDAYSLLGNSTAPLNTIDHPELEFEMARLQAENFDELRNKILSQLDFAASAKAIEPAMKYDRLQQVAQVSRLLGPSAITRAWERQGRIRIADFDYRLDETLLGIYRHMAETVDDAPTRQNLGNQYRNRGRFAEALKEYQRVLALDPAHADTQFQIGICNENLARYQQAVDAYRLAQKEKPQDPDVPYQLAGLFMLDGQYDKALLYVDQALALKRDGKGYLQKGNILSMMGNNSEAVANYQLALQLEPDNRDVQLALNRYLGK